MTHGTEQCRFETLVLKSLKKTVQKQATLRITVGKRTGFEPLFGPLLDTFLNKSLIFFDLVYSRYSDPSGDFAPLPCTVYLVYTRSSIKLDHRRRKIRAFDPNENFKAGNTYFGIPKSDLEVNTVTAPCVWPKSARRMGVSFSGIP